MDETKAKILLAQKAFSGFYFYPLIREYLAGATASGLFEARLGAEEMKKENHVFSPAYKDEDMEEITRICDHIIFNSVNQLKKYKKYCLDKGVSIGIRINPEFSTQEDHEIYDPCASGSRLGITLSTLENALKEDASLLSGVDGLHFHTLCEQGAEPLRNTLEVVYKNFGKYLKNMKWLNFGGGHHITRDDYNRELLIKCINEAKSLFDVEVYLEPGEAVALNAGYSVTTILDKTTSGDTTNLILDISAACHMPDVIEMPYRPPLFTSGEAGEKKYTYRLGSCTCLAGDIIGDFSFDEEKNIGDMLIFGDMAIYSFVKNNTFNGMPLPDLAVLKKDGSVENIKSFGYQDFKERLS
jgi:carboxynorspermidine decarboxylase